VGPFSATSYYWLKIRGSCAVRGTMNARLCTLAVVLSMLAAAPVEAATRTNSFPKTLGTSARAGTTVKEVQFGQSRLIVSYVPADFRLSEQHFVDWVLRSARATATFFGRFPVAEVRISLEPDSGAYVGDAVAWASPNARIRIAIGRNITARTLKGDSTLVHEMTHLAFPDLDESHLWLHEGVATYVESIARVQAGETSAAAAWAHFVEEMPQGLPGRGDKGLDDTPSIDRLYWGGALFCLVADIEIRRRTQNRFGLKDGLRAVLAAGGTLADTWEIDRTLGIADKAVGVPVLQELFAKWKSKSVAPDLDVLWAELGVRRASEAIRLVDSAPMAAIRRAITEPPSQPLLLAGPSLLRERRVAQ
jgi:hypothetical protein